MATPRFFVEAKFLNAGSLGAGQHLELAANISHHMIHVLRLREGTDIVLFNGQGGEFAAQILNIARKSVTVQVGSFTDINRTSNLSVHLGMCVIKKDSMDRVIGRATELGVAQITPLISDYCAVANKLIFKRQTHWQQVAVSACEQCGLNVVPEILEPIGIRDWIRQTSAPLKLVCKPAETALNESGEVSGVELLVGPEGGLSESELTAAEAWGFRGISLGERILRAETAPLVAITLLQAQLEAN